MRTSTRRWVTPAPPFILLVAALSVGGGCARDRSEAGCYVCAAGATVLDGALRTECLGAEAAQRYLQAGYLCQDPISGSLPPIDPGDPPPVLPGSKQILAYGFPGVPSVPGVIDEVELAISVTVPDATSVTSLVASFVATGPTVTVNGVTQVSGVTANDFTSPVSYVVTALDGSRATYVVTVIRSTVTPQPPTGVRAEPGLSMATVSWTASADAWSYSVYCSTSASVSPTSYLGVARTPVGAQVTSVPIAPLQNGTTYYFVVTADNGGFVSAPSSPPAAATPTASGTWTWAGGFDPASGSTGVYGTRGTAADANIPPPRERAMTWTTPDGSLWLFGGARRDGTGTSHFNDLWRFDGQRWTWVAGSNLPNQAGTLSGPGAREGGATWIDASGNLWVLGGTGRDSTGTVGPLNDLWRFTVASGAWSWMDGSPTLGTRGTYGTRGSLGPGNEPGARDGAVVWVTSSGNTGTVWLFGGYGHDSAGTLGRLNDLWKFDGTWWGWMAGSNLVDQPGSYGTLGTPSAASVPGARSNGAAWTDSAGRLWLLGGQGSSAAGNWFSDLWRIDPASSPLAWAWMGGPSIPDQLGTYGTKGAAAAGNWPGARGGAVCWRDATGDVWLFGGFGWAGGSVAAPLGDLWRFDGSSWTWAAGADANSQPASYGTKGVPAASNDPGARQFGAGWPGPGGSLLLFGGGSPDRNDLWLYQP